MFESVFIWIYTIIGILTGVTTALFFGRVMAERKSCFIVVIMSSVAAAIVCGFMWLPIMIISISLLFVEMKRCDAEAAH